MDDIKRIDLVDIELTGGSLHRSWCKHSIGTADALANAFGVRVFRDGEAVNLEGGTVEGFFRDPQGNNIAISGSSYRHIDNNVAYIILPQACYNYEGQFTLAIKLINSGAGITGTMRIVDGMVDNTNTGSAVAPTGEVPTYEEVLAVYEEMLEAKAGSVRFDITQSLSNAEKEQALENIEAASQADMDASLSGLYVLNVNDFERGNLYDYATVTTGKYIDNSGTEQTSSNLLYTDYIPVKAGVTYFLNFAKQTSPGGFYDIDKTYVGKATTETYGSYCTYTAAKSGYARFNAGISMRPWIFICVLGEQSKYQYYDAVHADTIMKNRQAIDAMIAPANLYDKNAPVTEDTILLNDGTTAELEGNFITGYIGIPGGGEYAVSYTLSTPGCAYDAGKNLLCPVYTADITSAAKKVFTLPEAAKYVRLNIPDGQRNSFVLAKGGNVNVNSYGQNAMPGLFMEQNLYTQEGVTAGALLLNDGSIDESSDFAVSDYIELPGTGVYTVPYAFSSPGCLYDINKTYISRAYTDQSSNTQYSFEVTNANARYIRLNLKIADVNSFVFCHGYGLAEVPYGAKMIDGLKVFARDIIGTVASRWAGKTIVCFGDSRTWYDGQQYGSATKEEWAGRTCVGYQQALAELMGANIVSQGVSGETSAQICTRIRAYNFGACDAVLLEGGVNDYVKSSQVTIGEIAPIGSTFDTTTVYGAWQSAVEYIQTNYPQVKIFMDVPAIAWTSGGVFPYNTAKIKAEIAELYNLPCVDLYKEAGITVCNYDYYYVDDVDETGWHLHFNDYGNRLVGEILAGFMNTH